MQRNAGRCKIQKCAGELKWEWGGCGGAGVLRFTSTSRQGRWQELRHREESGGGSGAPSVLQPAMSLLITGMRTGNMMEDDDKTTGEQIDMNPPGTKISKV